MYRLEVEAAAAAAVERRERGMDEVCSPQGERKR